MFLRVEDADVSGLCHKSEVSDKKSKNVFKALQGFREGDRVKAVIVGVDKEKGRVNFSIKPSLFGDAAPEESDEEEDGGDEDEEMEGSDDENVEDGEEDDQEDDEEDGQMDEDDDATEDELDFEDVDDEDEDEDEDEDDVEVSDFLW